MTADKSALTERCYSKKRRSASCFITPDFRTMLKPLSVSLMSRQKILGVCGLLLVALSMGAGFVYRDTVLRSALGIPALIVVAIAGTAAVVASRSSARPLHDSESRFRQLFDISPFPAVVTSLRDNRVLAINQRTSDRFGISQSKAVGAHAPDFYVDPSQRELMVEQLKKHGQIEGLLIQLRTPSGELFWADTSARLITFEGEQATLSVFHDATERVAAEQALRASEQRLASENKALTELMVRQAGNLARFEDQLRDILETCAVTVG